MADDQKSVTSHRRSLLEENFRQKRKLGLRELRRYGIVSLLVSLLTLGFGVWNLVVATMDNREWPYVIPIGCIAAILGFIPSVTALHFAISGLKFEEPGDRTRGSVTRSHKSQIWVIFVSALYNFILLLLCCAGSVLGIVLCADDHANCDAYGDSKLAFSIAVAVLSLLLWVTSFFYSRWYFIYTRAFGFKSKAERHFDPKQAMELQKRQQQKQQQQQQQQQQESQTNHHNHEPSQPSGQTESKDES